MRSATKGGSQMKIRRGRTYRLYPQTKTRLTNLTLALVLVFASTASVLPVLFTQTATAAPGLVYSNSGFSALNLSTDRSVPSGGYTQSGDSLTLRVDNTAANTSSSFYQTEGLQSPLAASRSIRAQLYVDPTWAGKPVRAGLWGIAGNTSTSDVAWPIIEYTNTGDGSYTGWRVFDTINGGWTNVSSVSATSGQWYTLEITFNAATNSYDYYVNGSLAISKTAVDTSVTPALTYGNLQGVIFNNYNTATGDHAQDYAVQWRNFQSGVSPVTAACTATNSVVTTNLDTWNTSDTRSAGHNQLLANGLHIYTDDGSSNAKAAGYYPASFPLSALGNQAIADSIDYQSTLGTTPGLQLVVDFNHDGTPDGILVGESVYGNNWWLSNSASQFVKDGAPSHSGGYGSANNGTIDQWLSSFPDAQVQSIGYSLGSGVHGDGILKRITLGCTNYTFGLAAPSLVTPANDAYVASSTVTNTWTNVSGAAKYEYQSFNDAAGTQPRFDAQYTTTSKTATGVANGTVFYWRVRALDSNGAPGPWSNGGNLWKITIDTAAPSTPTLLAPTNNAYLTTHNFGFDWTDASDTNGVQYHWESSYSNGTAADGSFLNPLASHMLSSSSVDSPGTPDGAYYWHVQAVDQAGNKSAWTPIWKVTVDTQAPATPTNLSWKTSGNATIADNGFTNVYDGTASWQDTASDVDHYIYKYWNDISGNPYKVGNEYVANVTGNTLPGVFNQGEGTHHFCVIAVDTAGNQSACSTPFTITYDKTKPTIVVNTPANTFNPATISVTGNDTIALAKVTANIYDASNTVLKKSCSAAASGTSYLLTCNTSSLTEGTYTIRTNALDKAGNLSTTLSSTHFTVDHTAPSVAIPTYGQTGNQIQPTVNASDPSTPLSYAWTTSVDSSDVSISDTSASEPIFTVHTDGTYSFTLTVTDAAGNATATTFSFTYTSPATTPAVTTTQSPVTPTSSFTAVTAAPAATQNTPTPSQTPVTDNGKGTVLGTNTDGKVKGDSTVNITQASNKKSGSFLLFGWWWLAIIGAIAALWLLLARRRRNTQN